LISINFRYPARPPVTAERGKPCLKQEQTCPIFSGRRKVARASRAATSGQDKWLSFPRFGRAEDRIRLTAGRANPGFFSEILLAIY